MNAGRREILLNSATVVASVVLTLLVAEAALQLLPVDWHAPIQAPTAQDPIQRYVPNSQFVSSIGWNLTDPVRSRVNAQGWLADYDYNPQATTPLIAVIGDSYIEAYRVPFAHTVTGRLQAALLNHARAYAFAQSGAPLSQYVAYAHYACTTFKPERLAVLVVDNDFDESIYSRRAQNGFFHLRRRADGGLDPQLTPLRPERGIERALRHSALFVYLMRNVGANRLVHRLGIHLPPTTREDRTAEARNQRLRDGFDVIAWFVDTLAQASCLPPDRITLIVDAMRPVMYDGDAALEKARNSYFARMRTALIEAAAAKGYGVIDMQPLFRAAFASDGRRFEFPTDRHWNEHGHEVAAAALLAALAPWPSRHADLPQ